MSKATIYDVAGAARVSLATVSRAINNPEKVKPETRERVLKVIEELGYKPNAFAKGLASRKSTTVAVVVPDMSRASIAEMMNGIADIARVYKYSILLYILESEEASEEDTRDIIMSEEYDWIKITVTDNGIGFDQSFAEKIFAPFQRLHGRSEYKGTGIGLAVCRRIVERHNGQITATSAQGHGATFTIIIPVDSEPFGSNNNNGEIHNDA